MKGGGMITITPDTLKTANDLVERRAHLAADLDKLNGHGRITQVAITVSYERGSNISLVENGRPEKKRPDGRVASFFLGSVELYLREQIDHVDAQLRDLGIKLAPEARSFEAA